MSTPYVMMPAPTQGLCMQFKPLTQEKLAQLYEVHILEQISEYYHRQDWHTISEDEALEREMLYWGEPLTPPAQAAAARKAGAE